MIPLRDDNPTSTTPYIANTILLTCVIVFVFEIVSPDYLTGNLFYSWGLVPAALVHDFPLPDEAYRIHPVLTIFTSMFMHGGFMHIIGNMLYLWIFADNIEDDIGHTKFLIFYLLSGVAAALTQVFMNPESTTPMVGASGAIGGVLGAYIVNYPKAKVLVLLPLGFIYQTFRVPAVFVLGIWFIMQFLNNAISDPSGGGVAYGAHIGGFIFGAISILFFNRGVKRKKIVPKKSEQKVSKQKNPWAK